MASTSAPANLARLPPAWQPAADRLTCYYNSASQPSRACLQLLLEGKVDFKRVEIGLGGSQKKPEFKEVINPAGFVPVVYDEGEKRFIPESTDIMRHLSGRYPSLGSFYAGLPAEKKAQVDEILTFSAEKVRPITTGITRSIALSRDAKETAELKARIPGLVDQLEGRLREVKSGGAADPLYFAGTVGPSIADIQVCHISIFACLLQIH